jgi:hypothetical protein
LQESSEEQVASLEQCNILGVNDFTLRQQAGDFQVEKSRSDNQEFTGLIEFFVVVETLQV